MKKNQAGNMPLLRVSGSISTSLLGMPCYWEMEAVDSATWIKRACC